uniref:Beta-glucuronidase n=1 Tax=Clastoptera arizonana TaxID=38151 RepID=A0A1B6CIU9_9HEMI
MISIKYPVASLAFIFLILVNLSLTSSSVVELPKGGILYPRASESRTVHSLDGVWNFRKSDYPYEGIEARWYERDLKKTGPVIQMPVPSSYNDITEDRDIRDHVGVVWYDRTFFVPDSWRTEGVRVWLRFSSVHYYAQVWVNGQMVVQHEVGHLPFQSEITSVVKFGRKNRVTVYVDNTLTLTTVPQGTLQKIQTNNGSKIVQRYSFDFYNYAGIHRSVHLYTTPSVYIDDITVSTDIEDDRAWLNYELIYRGSLGTDREEINCTVNIIDADGKMVCFETTSILFGDVGGSNITGRIEIPNPKFWWPYGMDTEPGYQYEIQFILQTPEIEKEDIYRLPIGVRKLRWDNQKMYINDKEIYIRGFGKHEDSDIRGKGLDLALAIKDHNLLQWIGANCYRTSHYPYAEEIMDIAEQYGIMIIDEGPSVNTENFTQSELQKHKIAMAELIRRDKNRANVIMWSVANEPRTADPESGPYFGSVVAFTKTLEKRRPVTAVLNRWYTVDQVGQFMDIICFNRYNSWYTEPGKLETIQLAVVTEAENWHRKYNKPVIMAEYGAEAMEGLHIYPDYIWSEEYQVSVLSEHFKAFDTLRQKDFFIGEMIWNFADFKTDQSITRVGGNKKGVFTRQRQPKASAFHVRRRYHQLSNAMDGMPLPKNLYKYTGPTSLGRDDL